MRRRCASRQGGSALLLPSDLGARGEGGEGELELAVVASDGQSVTRIVDGSGAVALTFKLTFKHCSQRAAMAAGARRGGAAAGGHKAAGKSLPALA